MRFPNVEPHDRWPMSSGLANQLWPSEWIQKPHGIEAQAVCKQMMAFRRKLRTERVVNSLDGQFSPPFAPQHPHQLFHHRLPPQPPNICFLVLTCLAHIIFPNSAPTHSTIHLKLIIHFLFFIYLLPMFSMIFLPQLPNFLGIISCPFFPMSKASITSSIPPTKHFQSLMSSAFPTLFLLNFLYYNLTTRNSMLCSFQMFSPITFLNMAVAHLTVNIHIINKCYCHPSKRRRSELTISPHRIF